MSFRSEKTRYALSERGAGAAGLGTRVVPDERALRAARSAAGLWGTGAEDGGETV